MTMDGGGKSYSVVSVPAPCIVPVPNLGDSGLGLNSHVALLYIPSTVIQGTNVELSPVKDAINASIFSGVHYIYIIHILYIYKHYAYIRRICEAKN